MTRLLLFVSLTVALGARFSLLNSLAASLGDVQIIGDTPMKNSSDLTLGRDQLERLSVYSGDEGDSDGEEEFAVERVYQENWSRAIDGGDGKETLIKPKKEFKKPKADILETKLKNQGARRKLDKATSWKPKAPTEKERKVEAAHKEEVVKKSVAPMEDQLAELFSRIEEEDEQVSLEYQGEDANDIDLLGKNNVNDGSDNNKTLAVKLDSVDVSPSQVNQTDITAEVNHFSDEELEYQGEFEDDLSLFKGQALDDELEYQGELDDDLDVFKVSALDEGLEYQTEFNEELDSFGADAVDLEDLEDDLLEYQSSQVAALLQLSSKTHMRRLGKSRWH